MVNMLQKKVFNDASEHKWQLVAIICVCTLGVALFSGFNLYASTIENELNRSYSRFNLADYWVYKSGISPEELAKVRNLPHVTGAEYRKLIDLSLYESEDSTLRIHCMEGQGEINAAEVISGEALAESDRNALLLDYRFAQAKGVAAGDSLFLGMDGQREAWFVKGIVRDVEYAYYAPNGLTIPDYDTYGFAYANASAFPQVPFNELILTADEAAEPQAITAQIRETLGVVNIVNRSYHASVGKIEDDLSGNRKIGTLFPIVFFLTAALITWITIGRIMESGRHHLGTLRSLGFAKREIILRYTFYGALISGPSLILGWLVSRFFIASTLYRIATTYYSIDINGVDLLSIHFLFAALGVVIVTCGSAYLSCGNSLKFAPATLMRPKSPAAGHRILLEHISPFWKRLSFSGKIVARNLFRYKSRMAMGLAGIIGSTALILCGFGIMTSIGAMIDKSFADIIKYDAEVKLKAPLSVAETAELLKGIKGVESFDCAFSFGITAYGVNGNAQNPYLVVLEDAQSSLIFKDAQGNPVSLPMQGALITPRMNIALDVGTGGTIAAEGIDGTALALKIAGIIDFPVGNEIYMSQTAFSEISDSPFSVRAFFCKGAGTDVSALRHDPRVAVVETKEEMRENLNIVLEIMQEMQIMLIVFSGLLSIAVMMVLGRMNYDERIRELATLKVLGFHKDEMKRLVLRENVWITAIGLPFGTVASYFLLRAVLSLAASPDMEISPSLNILWIAVGCALTLAFTLFVNFMMSRKFKSIDMVASLKSVE